MGKRTPYTQRVDEDLQDFVQRVSDATNLGKAGVIDEALRRLRDRSTITDDGQFLVEDETGFSTTSDGSKGIEEVLDNQEKMMAMLSDPSSFSASSNPNKNSEEGTDYDNSDETSEELVPTEDNTSDTEHRIDALAGEYTHDECLSPGEVESLDAVESEVVSATKRYLVPATTGMINHQIEEGKMHGTVGWRDVRELLRRLDVSRGSVYNYRDKMVQEGVLYPHPEEDELVVGDDATETVQRAAALEYADVRASAGVDFSMMDDRVECRYKTTVEEYVSAYMDWGRKRYYTNESAYVKKVVGQVLDAACRLAQSSPSTHRVDRGERTEREEMLATSRALIKTIAALESRAGINRTLGELRNLISSAPDVSSSEELEAWLGDYGRVRVELDELIEETYGSGSERSVMDEDEAYEVLGLDGDVTEEQVRDAYEDIVLDVHPDSGRDGEQEDVDVERYQRVLKAKRTLLD
ncbi:J domain-containing protein [Halorubellus salinus]|uniref:J domain-containing protein n=1 Tax=Halorubellus salinus TaxID=755309 RepID=UPI001D089129|nr:J domain-containing protein [Halorubellus salinus]